MPEKQTGRTEIAEALLDAAEQIKSGSVQLRSETDEQDATSLESPRFELERDTDSEPGEQRYELGWTE